MTSAAILDFFLAANGSLSSLREIVQDMFNRKEVDPGVPPPQFTARVVPVFTQLEGLDNLDDRTKIVVALVNRLLPNALKDATDFNHLQAVFNVSAAALVQKKLGAEIPNFDVFTVEDKKYFHFDDGQPPASVVDAVEQWITTKFIPNTELRYLSGLDDRKTITNIVRFTSTQVSDLNPISSNVIEQRTVLNLGIIEYPTTESQYFKLYKVELHAWVEKVSLGGGVVMTKYRCGLRGEFNTYGFEPRPVEDFDRLSQGSKEKMLEAFDAFTKDLIEKVCKPATKPSGIDGQAESWAAHKLAATNLHAVNSLF